MKKIDLRQGHLYRVVYKFQSGNYRWYKYEAYMTYLGDDGMGGCSFNLRPAAGTQHLAKNSIIEAEDLGPTQGRDDRRHRARKSLGTIKAPEREQHGTSYHIRSDQD